MDTKTKRVLGYIGIGLAAALIGGGLMWAVMQATLSDAEERAEVMEGRVGELESEIASLAAGFGEEPGDDSSDASYPPPSDGSGGSSGSGDSDSTPPPASADGRFFCFVRDVQNVSGTTRITVDYADFLTGDEAAAAAADAGEESPPPNDYFIRNVNPMLREFPVQSGISVRLTSTSDGTNPSGYTVPLGQWHDFYIGMTADMEVVRDVPYWITVAEGVVTAIEEQYIP